MQQKKVFFASDLHLGLPSHTKGLEREKNVVLWLDKIKDDASEIFLVGDIFDFWYEYRRVIPKGFTRFLGKIAELTDSGIKIHFFTGNHDVWMFDYFPNELGVILHREPFVCELLGKKFFIGHGDALGPGDIGYKILKHIFISKTLQWLFSRLHPNFALWLGTSWSNNSRSAKPITHNFKNEEEQITRFAREILEKDKFDYFVFGHFHCPIFYQLDENSNLIILGDWIVSNTFGEWDGKNFTLKRFHSKGTDELIGMS